MILPDFSAGRTVIVAGGPSLAGFDWRRLDGERVIAINRACEVLPHADVLWWSDAGFARRHGRALADHPAPVKATGRRGREPVHRPPATHVFRFTGLDGFDPRPGCLRHGNGSAHAALHLAVSLGARDVVLLGCDMAHRDGRTHWHDGHGLLHRERTLTAQMLPHFAALAEPFRTLGVRVIVAAPSRIGCWPVVPPDEALA